MFQMVHERIMKYPCQSKYSLYTKKAWLINAGKDNKSMLKSLSLTIDQRQSMQSQYFLILYTHRMMFPLSMKQNFPSLLAASILI